MTVQHPSAMRSSNALLAKHPLFADLPDEYARTLLSTASEATCDEGQIIFREGEPADRFYLIIEGRVDLEAFSLQYGSMVIDELESGDAFGWSVLVPPHRWRFDARARSRTRLLVLDGPALREHSEKDPGLGYALLQRFAMLLEQRLQAVRRQLIERRSRSW